MGLYIYIDGEKYHDPIKMRPGRPTLQGKDLGIPKDSSPQPPHSTETKTRTTNQNCPTTTRVIMSIIPTLIYDTRHSKVARAPEAPNL